jgi:hypothetical protein
MCTFFATRLAKLIVQFVIRAILCDPEQAFGFAYHKRIDSNGPYSQCQGNDAI